MRAGAHTTQHENKWREANPPGDTPAWEAELPSQVRAEAGASARGARRGRDCAGNYESAEFSRQGALNCGLRIDARLCGERWRDS
jgi:hypothetical protein